MKKLSIPLRAVFYCDRDRWIAHCLEFDLVGDGDTREEALKSLATAIELQLQMSIEHQNLNNLFTPADGEIFRKFAEGKKFTASGMLDLHLDPDIIESFEAREYTDPSDSGCEVAMR